MAYNLKEYAKKPERLAPGHRMCAGCGAPPVVRAVLRGLHPEDHAVITSATGCLEVCTYIYPYTAWEDSFIHTAFENSGATSSGVEAAYQALKRKGNLPTDKDVKASDIQVVYDRLSDIAQTGNVGEVYNYLGI